MKFVAPRPFADPAVAARKLLEIANATEAVQVRIEKVHGPFLGKAVPRPNTVPGSPLAHATIFDQAAPNRLSCGWDQTTAARSTLWCGG